ncbi:hypothetical protein C5167_046382, partial [Papaver somniferum]
MLDLNKYGRGEREKFRVAAYMNCVIFMMLFVLMLRRKHQRRKNSQSMGLYCAFFVFFLHFRIICRNR